MADKLKIQRLKVLPPVLAPSTLYITRTVGNAKLVDITVTGDTIAEVRKVMGVTETTELINSILETWVPKRALKSDISDKATLADKATAADKLSKQVNVTLTGDVTGTAKWDGSTDLSIRTTGGGGGGDYISPLLMIEQTFNTNIQNIANTPIEYCFIPNKTWSNYSMGMVSEFEGLMAEPETHRGHLEYNIYGEENPENYRTLRTYLKWRMGTALYEMDSAVDLMEVQIESHTFVKLAITNDGDALELFYGPGYWNRAILPKVAGNYMFSILRDVSGYTITLEVAKSDSPIRYNFRCTDPVVPTNFNYPENLVWGQGGIKFNEVAYIEKFSISAL